MLRVPACPMWFRLTVLVVLGIAPLVSLMAWAAQKETVAKPKPDYVMADRKCVGHVSRIGNEKSPLQTEVPAKVRFCWRSGPNVVCDQMVPGDSAKPHKFSMVVAEEESPRMVLAGTDSALAVIIDWSRGEYVLAQTYYKQSEAMIVQLQCPGSILTGAAFEEYQRSKARPSQ